ncbi:MAG: TonB family protein [Acidobacteria bacterium]|nr:TonB family protein [Acidobacteriota bacterium]MCA1643076.1 TonB family protein [Acidobacteriota bacterium]
MNTPHKLSARSLKPLLLACACLLAAGAHVTARPQQQPTTSVALSEDAKRGIEQYKRGEADAAIKSLRAATKKSKGDAVAWYYLGLSLLTKGKAKDARAAFEAALSLSPDFVAGRNGLAYALLYLGKAFEAMRVSEDTLKLDQKNAESHYVRGLVQYRLNYYSKALEASEGALKLDPSFANGLFLKSQALVAMSGNALTTANDETADVREVLLKKIASRLDEANEALDKFLRLNPQGARNAEAVREEIMTLRVYGAMSGAASPDGAIYTAKELTTRAIIKDRPEPLYTERARQNQVTGTVRVRMVLAADGTVKYVVAVNRLPDGLTEASIRAARRIKFIPATKDGRPVSQYVTIDYNFNIY